MLSLAHKYVSLVGGFSDRRPQRDEFVGINWDSDQCNGLTACFPMWSGGGMEIDLISGYKAYPTNVLTYLDPQMGWVYYGDNGGTLRGGGAPATPRYYNVGAFSNGQSGSTDATGYPRNMDPGCNVGHLIPARSATWTAWVKLVNKDGWILNGGDLQQPTSGGNNPANAYVTSFAANAGAFPGSGFGVGQHNPAGTGIYVELDIDGAVVQRTIIGFTPLNDGYWHHIAGVYESAGETNPNNNAGHMRTYVDGVLDCTESNNNYDIASAVPALESWLDQSPWGTAIGSDTDFKNAQWYGMFCDFRFYMRALTESDIRAMVHPDSRWELYRPRRYYSPTIVGQAPLPTRTLCETGIIHFVTTSW